MMMLSKSLNLSSIWKKTFKWLSIDLLFNVKCLFNFHSFFMDHLRLRKIKLQFWRIFTVSNSKFSDLYIGQFGNAHVQKVPMRYRDVTTGKYLLRPLWWWAVSAPLGWDRVKASENLGATSVALVAPVVTSLEFSVLKSDFVSLFRLMA